MMISDNRLRLEVHARRMLTETICEFDLRPLDGVDLPHVEAGDSLIVETPAGELRNYSICNDDRERHRYVVAVKREAASRGGSRSMHEHASVGAVLAAETSRTGLRLKEGPRHLLIAGGIGVTPVMSLLYRLLRGHDGNFEMIYLARSPEEAAYADLLRGPRFEERVLCYFSSENAGRRLDLGPWLRDNSNGAHLYYCGPPLMMEAVRLGSIHWARSHVHAEQFSVDKGTLSNKDFQVRQSSTGRVFVVHEDQTILDSLRAAGFTPASSCESGTCGKCYMRLVGGEVEHRDVYLSPDERPSAIMPCISRAAGDIIEIDF